MKKILLVVVTIIVALLVYVNVNAEEIVIPDSSIRFRVIANSNGIKDQKMKVLVKEYIDDYLAVKMVDINSKDDAKKIIEDEIDNMNNEIKKIFEEHDYTQDFVVYYGENFFPDKIYKGVNYKSGSYESLVITIGKGEGDNWWCVLFPPLCLLEAQESDVDDVEYQFFVKELITGIFE